MRFDQLTTFARRSRNAVNGLISLHVLESSRTGSRSLLRLAAVPPAIGTLWDARREILAFLRTGDEEVGYHLRRRFGLGPDAGTTHPVPTDLFDGSPSPGPTPPATIIIPVFNAADHVARLLTRLPETVSSEQSVLVVNDGSDDPRIADILSHFADRHANFSVIDMPGNLGFVAAVNAGLERIDPDHHAILLNSDTLPPRDWVPRLLAPIADDEGIASVTPLSNAAEILSIPRPGIVTELSVGRVDRLDAVAKVMRGRVVDLPTGVGFCMALNRRFLDRIGRFDPSFGRGYGEEVDWCRKAADANGRNVAVTNLFVGHAGSASFGTASRAAQISRASRKIARRHPAFADDASTWERRDPIGPERLALSLGWAAGKARAPVAVYVAHSLGGGAETALQQEIAARFRESDDPVVILRAGGPLLWRVELRGPRFVVAGDVAGTRLLHRLLEPLTVRHVIYSCAVRSEDPGGVPNTLLELSKGQRLELRLHDFLPVSPSWNLIGSDGRYSGVPPLDSTDLLHSLPARGARPGLSHRAWREKWGTVIEAADEITAFAESGAELIEAAHLNARGKVRVRPHTVPDLPARLAPGGSAIGVLGGINLPKGGGVLECLARETSRRIVVIGEMDSRFRLGAYHFVHGRYDRTEIAALAKRYDVGLWFIPSICPETFSFATREALATGLPVVAFDLGAQGEAVRAAPNGHVLTSPPDSAAAIAGFLDQLFGKAA